MELAAGNALAERITEIPETVVDGQRSYRYLIYSLFLLSGVSGLIYQIVWTRLLMIVFGNTMLATSTVLSAFMGGLAAGSYVLGRYIDRKPRRLIQVYAMLEAGIGLFALLFPFLIHAVTPIYTGLYSAVAGNIVMLNLGAVRGLFRDHHFAHLPDGRHTAGSDQALHHGG